MILVMHHIVSMMIANIVVFIDILIVTTFPATCSRNGKMINNGTRTVFASCQNVTHTSLIHIESTELRDFAFVLLHLVELNMLRCTLDIALLCLVQLVGGHGRLLLSHRKSRLLLHAVTCGQHLLLLLMLPLRWLWHWQLSLIALQSQLAVIEKIVGVIARSLIGIDSSILYLICHELLSLILVR